MIRNGVPLEFCPDLSQRATLIESFQSREERNLKKRNESNKQRDGDHHASNQNTTILDEHKNLRGNLLDKRHRQPRREASPRDTLLTLIFLSKLKPNPKTRRGCSIYKLGNKKRDTWAATLNSARR